MNFIRRMRDENNTMLMDSEIIGYRNEVYHSGSRYYIVLILKNRDINIYYSKKASAVKKMNEISNILIKRIRDEEREPGPFPKVDKLPTMKKNKE